jgi:ATP-dependent RNA helicase SUPV3L1/SUV3
MCATALLASPARSPPLSEEVIEKIEGHDFEPVRVLQWRTPNFRLFVDRRAASLDRDRPGCRGSDQGAAGVDQRALEHLAGDPAIRSLANNRQRVALLWDACALPDYRRIAPAQHADLIGSIFQDLAERGHVDEAYMAEQVRRADTTDGDIDTLSQRIAQIRTWTFVSHRPGWLADPTHWQGKTREIEDRLSDALHERLTKRFVDRRTSVLMRRLRENSMLEAEISPPGLSLLKATMSGSCRASASPPTQARAAKTARPCAPPPRRRWRRNLKTALKSSRLRQWRLCACP